MFDPYRIKLIDIMSKSKISEIYQFLLKSQYWSMEQIENYQNNKLREIIKHSYNHVPYYRNQFKNNNILPTNISSISDLDKLPILSRSDIKRNFNDLLSDKNKTKPQIRRTGGTTGVPLKYLSDMESWSMGWGLKLRDFNIGGYNLGENMAIMAGASLIPNQKRNYKRFLWNLITGFIPLSTTHYSKEIFDNYLKIIKKRKIGFLRGYPSSILGFAEYIDKVKENLPINAIFTTAEVLLPEHRKYIEEVFRCKIFDQYGAADAGAHAGECKNHDGFHISFEPSICEIINVEKDQNGKEIGELVFTNITNYAMPKIRYAPGDLAEISKKKCTCGRSNMVIKRIVGRTTERIVFFNGRVLAGPAFTLIFRDFNVSNYQLVQNSKDSIDVNIVKTKKYTLQEEKKILEIMKYHVGMGVSVNINYLDEIEKSKSGKNKFIISNLGSKI